MADIRAIRLCLQIDLRIFRSLSVFFVSFAPCFAQAQYSGILKQIEDSIEQGSTGYPQQRRTEQEKQKLKNAQDLGNEALRLGTQFTVPNIVGGVKGTWGVARGYSTKLRDVTTDELGRELLEQQSGQQGELSQQEADQRCVQSGGSPLICRNSFR